MHGYTFPAPAMLRESTPNPYAARRRRNDPDDSEAHAHRRETDEDAVLRLHARVDDAERDIKQILESQREMSENLRRLTDNTGRLADVLETWNNVKGFWWTVKMLSSAAKVIVPLLLLAGALAGAVWLYIRTGHWEFRQ